MNNFQAIMFVYFVNSLLVKMKLKNKVEKAKPLVNVSNNNKGFIPPFFLLYLSLAQNFSFW
jgi:hypothetical protein